jgi:exonuclease VII large subunit
MIRKKKSHSEVAKIYVRGNLSNCKEKRNLCYYVIIPQTAKVAATVHIVVEKALNL